MSSGSKKRHYDDSTEQEAESAIRKINEELEKQVTDEEIDEFYAILKRAREARNWILGVKREKREEAVKKDTWQPRFALEDFQLEKTSGTERSEVAVPAVPVPVGLDLNAKPEPVATSSHDDIGVEN